MKKEELKKLKRLAGDWGRKYPRISEVCLYKADPAFETLDNIIVISTDGDDEELEKRCAEEFPMLEELGKVVEDFSWEDWSIWLNDDFFVLKATRVLLYKRRDLSAPRKKGNELHDIIWKVYCNRKKDISPDPTGGVVWNYIEGHWHCGDFRNEFDPGEIIQEVKEDVIYWTTDKGKEKKLSKNGLCKALCRMKKENERTC